METDTLLVKFCQPYHHNGEMFRSSVHSSFPVGGSDSHFLLQVLAEGQS